MKRAYLAGFALLALAPVAFAQQDNSARLARETAVAREATRETFKPLNSREKSALAGGMADMTRGFTGFMRALGAARNQANADMQKQESANQPDSSKPASGK